MLTEVQKNEIRQRVIAENQKLQDALAPLYLGKFCPLIKGECEGPACMLFLPMGDTKITGGACCIPLLATQAAPIADGLAQLATQVAQAAGAAPRIQVPPAGLVR